jgi:hypothetical protein
MVQSGAPFNITTGQDLNGDGMFNDRPAFAGSVYGPNVIQTAWGNFLTNPQPGDPIIPRNYGRGPGRTVFNLRVGKTFGLGPKIETASTSGPGGPSFMGGIPGGGHGGPGGGGPRGGGGMRGGGGGPWGGGDTTNRRYNLTLSVQASNLLNHVNLASPVGNLSSPYFGESTQIAGGFGSSASANRRIELQLRFSF